VTISRERRSAAIAFGLLAAVLLAAGVLPWVTGGSLAIRLIGVPLLLLGLLAALTAIRLPSVAIPRRPAAPARPAHNCASCAARAAVGAHDHN
jgi:hypothetical protein